MCTRQLQPTRDDRAVRVKWFSIVVLAFGTYNKPPADDLRFSVCASDICFKRFEYIQATYCLYAYMPTALYFYLTYLVRSANLSP